MCGRIWYLSFSFWLTSLCIIGSRLIHLIRTDSNAFLFMGKSGWHHWLDGCESEWTPGVGDVQGGLVCCDSWGHKELDTTEWLNWTEYSIVYMYHKFFIHLSVDGCLGCFHVLGIVNSAAMNNGIHVSFSVLVFSGYMPRSGISGSYGVFFPPSF